MSESSGSSPDIKWAEVESSLNNLTQVDGGFTAAHRGIVKLTDGQEIFVKVGVDEDTKKWAHTEVQMYRFLQRHDYPFVPTLLAVNNDETSFALEVLKSGDGWDWSGISTSDRLAKTLEAMDLLASMTPADPLKEGIDTKTIFEYDDGWQAFMKFPERQRALTTKLRGNNQAQLAESLDFATMAEQSNRFVLNDDSLVHNDVRGDNCAWNPKLQTVKLVDWNWAGLGDRRIDVNAVLVSAQKNGLDVMHDYADRLDVNALKWLAGFWFNGAATPIWPGGPESLRDFQLQTGVVALDLANKL